MAFRDQTLEVELQLEEALKTARREARAMIRQMDGSSSDGSVRFNILDPRNSKPKANERLPELKLPVSSGKVLDFPTFWDRFQGSVHSWTDLDDASKFAYLLSSLSGEALAAVEGMPSSGENYSHAIELLQSRFRRKDAIVREHVKAIWNVKPYTDSGSGTQALIDEIQRHLRCLSALEKDPSTGEMMASDAFLPHLTERFPEEIRLGWGIHVLSTSGVKGDLREFLEFAEVRTAARRAAAVIRDGGGLVKQDKSNQHKPGSGRQEGHQTPQTERRAGKVATTVLYTAVSGSCLICNGGHDIASCHDNNALYLDVGVVTTSFCTVRIAYPGPDTRGLQVSELHAHCRKDSQCVVIQCLLDPGSQSSFIRKNVADALGLAGPHEAIHLVTVDNDAGTEQRMCQVEFHLEAVDPTQSRTSYPIQALVLPKNPLTRSCGDFGTPLTSLPKTNLPHWMPTLLNNFPQARRRLLAVERRLARCEEELREYALTMCQYVENGWTEGAPEIGPEGRTWYLPHHAVYQDEGKEKKC
ncbi:hypothetical protein T4B_8650 [Trichinella pseudospiralis]|uniref:Uncharacterized protein n=1 Tax=Trichinella pseudospiralis TaxID=6337 RepID=A0A0V1IAX6_TRIPS|nr:hypothetical protein T4B_8650 [Trichinella pseudospiralis]